MTCLGLKKKVIIERKLFEEYILGNLIKSIETKQFEDEDLEGCFYIVIFLNSLKSCCQRDTLREYCEEEMWVWGFPNHKCQKSCQITKKTTKWEKTCEIAVKCWVKVMYTL